MLEIIRYTPEWEQQWNDFVARAKNATFLFDRRYMEYHSDRFQDASYLFLRDGKPYALLPANRRDDTLYSHQGLTYGGWLLRYFPVSPFSKHSIPTSYAMLSTPL